MITINVVTVGNLKEKFWKDAQSEYLKRLSKFAKVNIIEIAEKNKESTPQITLEKESKDIILKLKGYKILLDLGGKNYSSEQFAMKLESLSQISSTISFIIGSSHGVSQKIKDIADEKISFGLNTYPHNLARIILLEQVYRGFAINSNSTYHK